MDTWNWSFLLQSWNSLYIRWFAIGECSQNHGKLELEVSFRIFSTGFWRWSGLVNPRTPKVVDHPPFCGAFWPQKVQLHPFLTSMVIVGRRFRQLLAVRSAYSQANKQPQIHDLIGWHLPKAITSITLMMAEIWLLYQVDTDRYVFSHL